MWRLVCAVATGAAAGAAQGRGGGGAPRSYGSGSPVLAAREAELAKERARPKRANRASSL
jgi:hypothetical protein